MWEHDLGDPTRLSSQPRLNQSRFCHSSVCAGMNLYVVGGINKVCHLDTIEVLSLQNSKDASWHIVDGGFASRANPAISALCPYADRKDERILIWGGFNGESRKFLGDVYIFDPTTDKSTKVAESNDTVISCVDQCYAV